MSIRHRVRRLEGERFNDWEPSEGWKAIFGDWRPRSLAQGWWHRALEYTNEQEKGKSHGSH